MAGRVTWLTSTKRRMSESAGYGYGSSSASKSFSHFRICQNGYNNPATPLKVSDSDPASFVGDHWPSTYRHGFTWEYLKT